MNPTYDIPYFYSKFSAIPEERWTKGQFTYGDKCCAQGHCGMRPENAYSIWAGSKYFSEASELLIVFKPLNLNENHIVAEINNGVDQRYQQPTPKQRILAALRDIAKLEGVTLHDVEIKQEQPKVIYRTVLIDAAVKQLTESELNQQ